MTKSDRIQIRINQKLKDKFSEYCRFHGSTVTDQIEQFMVLCTQFYDEIQGHAGRPSDTNS